MARVLYVITDSGVGGTEKALLTVLKNLDRSVAEPCGVLVLKEKRDMAVAWEQAGVRVQSFGMKRWPTPSLLFRLSHEIRRTAPDIVHAFLYHSIQLCRLAHRMNRSFKLVTSPRVNYSFAPKTALMIDGWLKSEDDAELCESESGCRSLVENYGYDSDKVHVAWNSVDGSVFHFDPVAREKLRAHWKVEPDELLIGSLGRLHRQKGYDILMNALRNMHGIRGKIRTVIVGNGPDRAKLEQLATTVPSSVGFAGQRVDVPSVLSALDIYVQSSRYEGLSNALLEAMSVGCACVATAVDGTRDFADDGLNMVLAKPNDPLSLALGLATVVEKPELRKRLSENAKITASKFSVQRMMEGFESVYRSVLK